jgi:post-segregation antitoxin (ccd killing protein)
MKDMKNKTKKELSISVDLDIIEYLKINHINRSKFIEKCIINELKNEREFEEIIEKLIIF